jgi:hypothetical protein
MATLRDSKKLLNRGSSWNLTSYRALRTKSHLALHWAFWNETQQVASLIMTCWVLVLHPLLHPDLLIALQALCVMAQQALYVIAPVADQNKSSRKIFGVLHGKFLTFFTEIFLTWIFWDVHFVIFPSLHPSIPYTRSHTRSSNVNIMYAKAPKAPKTTSQTPKTTSQTPKASKTPLKVSDDEVEKVEKVEEVKKVKEVDFFVMRGNCVHATIKPVQDAGFQLLGTCTIAPCDEYSQSIVGKNNSAAPAECGQLAFFEDNGKFHEFVNVSLAAMGPGTANNAYRIPSSVALRQLKGASTSSTLPALWEMFPSFISTPASTPTSTKMFCPLCGGNAVSKSTKSIKSEVMICTVNANHKLQLRYDEKAQVLYIAIKTPHHAGSLPASI